MMTLISVFISELEVDELTGDEGGEADDHEEGVAVSGGAPAPGSFGEGFEVAFFLKPKIEKKEGSEEEGDGAEGVMRERGVAEIGEDIGEDGERLAEVICTEEEPAEADELEEKECADDAEDSPAI